MPVWFVYNAPVGAYPLIRYGGVFVRGGGAAHCKVLNIAVEDMAGFMPFLKAPSDAGRTRQVLIKLSP